MSIAVLQVCTAAGVAAAVLVLKYAPHGKSLLCLHAASVSVCTAVPRILPRSANDKLTSDFFWRLERDLREIEGSERSTSTAATVMFQAVGSLTDSLLVHVPSFGQGCALGYGYQVAGKMLNIF